MHAPTASPPEFSYRSPAGGPATRTTLSEHPDAHVELCPYCRGTVVTLTMVCGFCGAERQVGASGGTMVSGMIAGGLAGVGGAMLTSGDTLFDSVGGAILGMVLALLLGARSVRWKSGERGLDAGRVSGDTRT